MTHPYKDILIAIANGEQIQWQDSNGEWLDAASNAMLSGISQGAYTPTRYRIKPKTIRIGEFDVPEPLREAPRMHSYFYLASATMTGPECGVWTNSISELRWLELGLLHTTKEAAQIHLDALLSFTRRSA